MKYTYYFILYILVFFSCTQNRINDVNGDDSIAALILTTGKADKIAQDSVIIKALIQIKIEGYIEGQQPTQEQIDQHNIRVYGHLYSSTNKIPSLKDSKTELKDTFSNGKYAYTSILKNLSSSTQYYTRAYIITKTDTFYGKVENFTTKSPPMPPPPPTINIIITTGDVTNITARTADVSSSFELEGTSILISKVYGYIYSSTNKEPSLGDKDIQLETASLKDKTLSSNIQDLNYYTTYYIRAYIIMEADTFYGEPKSFTTDNINISITTGDITDIKETTTNVEASADFDGNVFSEYSEYGHVYSSVNPIPTIDQTGSSSSPNKKTSFGPNSLPEDNTFTSEIKELEHSTTYYVRAYLTTTSGRTFYGEVKTFYTTTISTSNIDENDIKVTTAEVKGEIKLQQSTLTTYGHVYSHTNTEPNLSDGRVIVGTSISSAEEEYTSNIKNLYSGTQYYTRAYMTSLTDTIYGEVVSFTTEEYELSNFTDNQLLSHTFPSEIRSIVSVPGSPDVLIVVGYDKSNMSSAILKSTDAGNTWTAISTTLDEILRSVFFITPTVGYIVGHSGTILKTIDAGTTWTQQTSGTTEDLFAVHFSHIDTGFAVGDNNIILKTTDGGTTWVSTTYGTTTRNYDAVHFVSGKTWFVVGNSEGAGVIIQTTDGGTTWTDNANTGITSALHSISFPTSKIGYAVGKGMLSDKIIKTTDGGITWKTQSGGGASALYSVDFINADTGFAVGYIGDIFRTTDGGKNWVIQKGFSAISSFYSVHFTDDRIGYIVGKDGIVLKTTDCGETWFNVQAMSSVDFVDANTGFIVGGAGGIFKTTNGGNNWTQQTSGISYKLNFVRFIDANTGYIGGEKGSILKTTNGGTSWTSLTSKPSSDNTLNSAYFMDANTGFVVGDFSSIAKTINGGNTWVNQNVNINEELKSIHFSGSDTGYATGIGGIIFKTVDGGNTWSNLNSVATHYHTSTHFMNKDTGFVVGYDGFILKTMDGGTTWEVKTSGTDKNLYYITHFEFANMWFAVGEKGFLLQSKDGGDTWERILPQDLDFSSVFVLYDFNEMDIRPSGTKDEFKVTFVGTSTNVIHFIFQADLKKKQ